MANQWSALVAMATVIAVSAVGAASEVASVVAIPLSSGGAAVLPLAPTEQFTLEVFSAQTRDDISRTGQYVLPFSGELALVEEYDIFSPGHRKVYYYDEVGNLVHEEPYEGRLYHGKIASTGDDVFLLVSTHGITGTITRQSGEVWEFRPVSSALTGVFHHELAFYPANPASPPDPAPDVISYTARIRPYAEASFQNYAADWQDRIAASYGYWSAVSMWENELQTEISLVGIGALAQDFYSQTACGANGDLQDLGQRDFSENWLAYNLIGGINGYSLFHAADDGNGDVWGCSFASCEPGYGCLQDANDGNDVDRFAMNVVQAREWSTFDAYNADSTVHRALAVHHEFIHNAGQPLHPGDTNPCLSNNIMNSAASISCRSFWNVLATRLQIEDYGHPRFTSV